MRNFLFLLLVACAVGPASAQDVPDPYKAVLSSLGKTGDYKDNVLKVNIPRSDLKVTIKGRALPTPFGFGGWVAMTKGSEGHDVMMGDLVLTEDQVNPVMSALLDNGLEVTALHNHFFWEQPRIFYMHVHGMGTPADLAAKLKPALAIIDAAVAKAPKPAGAPAATPAGLDTAAIAKTVGHTGDRSGAVYKITVGRPDLALREHGALINSRMGLNTWAAFTGTDGDAAVAGDIAMVDREVTPVLKALRGHGIDVVAMHHHMIGTQPTVIFLHYYGTGSAASLAAGFKAALDELVKK